MSARKTIIAGFFGVCFLLEFVFIWSPVEASEARIRPTPFSMDFYGSIPGAAAGDRVEVFDADGVLCGAFTLQKNGLYGFLHVYGDDPSSPEDEGAEMGDELTFELNGKAVESPSHGPIYWIGDRIQERVDF